MLGEILAISAVGAAAFTVIDHENLLGNNPSKKWFWERPPFVPTIPAAQMPQRFIQPQPRLTPAQELQQARMGVIGAEQVLARVSQKFPELSAMSKYVVTS